jgi:hypothetical protein
MNQKLSMLLLVAGTWTVVAAAGGDETSKELDKLKGTWKVVYEEDCLRELVGVPTTGAV